MKWLDDHSNSAQIIPGKNGMYAENLEEAVKVPMSNTGKKEKHSGVKYTTHCTVNGAGDK